MIKFEPKNIFRKPYFKTCPFQFYPVHFYVKNKYLNEWNLELKIFKINFEWYFFGYFFF